MGSVIASPSLPAGRGNERAVLLTEQYENIKTSKTQAARLATVINVSACCDLGVM